jgi:hypothetical protein
MYRDRQGVDGIVQPLLQPFGADYREFFDVRKLSRLTWLFGERFGRVMLTTNGEYEGNYANIRR